MSEKQSHAMLVPVNVDDVDCLLQSLEFSRSMYQSKLDEFYGMGLIAPNVDVDHLENVVLVASRMIDKLEKYKRKFEIEEGS